MINACPQYFALTFWRTGQTFYFKAYGLQGAANYAFGTIGGENASRIKAIEKTGKEGLRPHFRLLFGRKGIEIDDIVLIGETVSGEIGLYFVQRKIRCYLNIFFPCGTMQGIEISGTFGARSRVV